MARLVLVRHAAVELVDGVPPEEWRLTEAGEAAAAELAESPSLAGVERAVSSPEPKARATAEALGLPVELDDRLCEVRRAGERVRTLDEHRERVARYLAGEPPEGWEPLEDVQRRVVAAIEEHEGPLAVVSHGMALTLYLAWLRGRPPDLEEWREMPLPAVCVVDRAARAVVAPWHGG